MWRLRRNCMYRNSMCLCVLCALYVGMCIHLHGDTQKRIGLQYWRSADAGQHSRTCGIDASAQESDIVSWVSPFPMQRMQGHHSGRFDPAGRFIFRQCACFP